MPQHATMPERVFPGDKKFQTPKVKDKSLRSTPPLSMVLSPDWRVLLNENFSASNVNMVSWWTRYIYSGGTQDYLNDEWERYRESGNHVCDGSMVHLTALPSTGDFYPSGMLRSKDKFPIANGDEWYLECRCRVPAGKGVWPAFWIAGVEREAGQDSSCYWPPEIDIMEIVNNGDYGDTTSQMHCCGQGWDDYQQNTWTWWDDTFNTDWAFWDAGFDFANGFHTHGLWYKYPEFTIYVDRRPVLAGTYAWNDWMGPVPGCHILCNLAIGGSWAGRNGVDETAFPQSLDVDYIRAYTRINQSTIGQNLLPV